MQSEWVLHEPYDRIIIGKSKNLKVSFAEMGIKTRIKKKKLFCFARMILGGKKGLYHTNICFSI